MSLRYGAGPFRAALTLWRQRLTDEIVDVYNPASFLSSVENSEGRSRRKGAELEAGWSPGSWLDLSAQVSLLRASEPAGRELRRPRSSGSVNADGDVGRISYGASLSHTGARRDRDFDQFPARLVTLDSYWLAGARLGYRLGNSVELFGRVANAFDAKAVDVVGYRSEGRTVYAGIRLGGSR